LDTKIFELQLDPFCYLNFSVTHIFVCHKPLNNVLLLHKFELFSTQSWNYVALQEFNVSRFTHTQINTKELCSDNGVNPQNKATLSSTDIAPYLLNDHKGLGIEIPHYASFRFRETFDKPPPRHTARHDGMAFFAVW